MTFDPAPRPGSKPGLFSSYRPILIFAICVVIIGAAVFYFHH